jgi:hypothetical protein
VRGPLTTRACCRLSGRRLDQNKYGIDDGIEARQAPAPGK